MTDGCVKQKYHHLATLLTYTRCRNHNKHGLANLPRLRQDELLQLYITKTFIGEIVYELYSKSYCHIETDKWHYREDANVISIKITGLEYEQPYQC